MVTNRRFHKRQSGSALIVILIVALIIGILWATRFAQKDEPASQEPTTRIRSTEDISRAINKSREAQKQQDEQLNKRMSEIDQVR